MVLDSLAEKVVRMLEKEDERTELSSLLLVAGCGGMVPHDLARRTMAQAEAVAGLMAARIRAPESIRLRRPKGPGST